VSEVPASAWLRPAEAGDAAALAEIHAQAFDAPWPAQALADTLAGPGAAGLLAGVSERALGLVLFRAVAGEAEILTLAVRPEARRRGLAGRLVEGAALLAAMAGAEIMWLEVAEDNVPALALYRRLGFGDAGRRPRYYSRPGARPVDALLMRRPLNTDAA
jgi:ribosomal-protein-alanine N-acetyltransferase